MRYAVIVEQRQGAFRAYVPDLPGCIATGRTVEEVESSIRLAIGFHLESLRREGAAVPPATSRVEYVAVSVPTR